MMKKILMFGFLVMSVLLVIGCQPQDSGDSGEGALIGEAVRFPGGDIASVQYLDTAIHTTTAGGDYQCTKMTAGTACALVAGKIQRTYVSGGVTRTALYADGCQTTGSGFKRSYDYGCLGSDVITCWKVCSAAGCDTSPGICAGDAYSACGNGVREGSEVCDGSDIAGQSCTSQGFTGGTLSCNADCLGFDTSDCTSTCTDGTYRTAGDGSSVEKCTSGAWVAATCETPEACLEGQYQTAAGGCENYCISRESWGGLSRNVCKGTSYDAVGACVGTTTDCAAGATPNAIAQTSCENGKVAILNETTTGPRRTVTDCGALFASFTTLGSNFVGNVSSCVSLAGYSQEADGQLSVCGSCGAKICLKEGKEVVLPSPGVFPQTCAAWGATDTGRVVSGPGCPVSCSDSDGSWNPSVKGSVTYTIGDGRIFTSVGDSCVSSNLIETYCGSVWSTYTTIVPARTNYMCGGSTPVCRDGACVAS